MRNYSESSAESDQTPPSLALMRHAYLQATLQPFFMAYALAKFGATRHSPLDETEAEADLCHWLGLDPTSPLPLYWLGLCRRVESRDEAGLERVASRADVKAERVRQILLAYESES